MSRRYPKHHINRGDNPIACGISVQLRQTPSLHLKQEPIRKSTLTLKLFGTDVKYIIQVHPTHLEFALLIVCLSA